MSIKLKEKYALNKHYLFEKTCVLGIKRHIQYVYIRYASSIEYKRPNIMTQRPAIFYARGDKHKCQGELFATRQTRRYCDVFTVVCLLLL